MLVTKKKVALKTLPKRERKIYSMTKERCQRMRRKFSGIYLWLTFSPSAPKGMSHIGSTLDHSDYNSTADSDDDVSIITLKRALG